MNGCNFPLLFLVAITVLVTVSVVMVSDLPLWGAFLLGAIVAFAGLFSIDVIIDVVEKRQRRNRKSLDMSEGEMAPENPQK